MRQILGSSRRFLGFCLQGPEALKQSAIDPLTLQFLGPLRETWYAIYDQVRLTEYAHALDCNYPLLIPILIFLAVLKAMQQSGNGLTRVVVAACLYTGPVIMNWILSHCFRPSSFRWDCWIPISNSLSFFGCALVDDHSGPLIVAFLTGQDYQAVYLARALSGSTAYSYVLAIGGVGWLSVLSLWWPVKPHVLAICCLSHIFFYSFPIFAFEPSSDWGDLVIQIILVAVCDMFMIIGRQRAEFKEKVALVSAYMVVQAKAKEESEKKMVKSLLNYAFDVHTSLAWDGDLVLEGSEEQRDLGSQMLRTMWPSAACREGQKSTLHFQELLATELERRRFKTAIASLPAESVSPQGQDQQVKDQPVQLLRTTLSVYEPGEMRTISREADLFILRCLDLLKVFKNMLLLLVLLLVVVAFVHLLFYFTP
ncbi:unnamed protein product [Polarella glacialis]|uniref:Uncharacterized protein n=1 Tax=Polarella glacialis TaxID=89957 RepID=A0A813KVI1_POLGL|nr:unnamed protein product [Polarella glacialis]